MASWYEHAFRIQWQNFLGGGGGGGGGGNSPTTGEFPLQCASNAEPWYFVPC